MAHLLKQVEGLAEKEGVSFYLISLFWFAFQLCPLFTKRAFTLWVLFGVLVDTGHECQFPYVFFFMITSVSCKDGSYCHCIYFRLVQSALCSGLPTSISLQTT